MTQKDPSLVKTVVVDASGKIDLTATEVLINFKDGAVSTKSPETNAEEGWINVEIDGVTKYIPYYAAS